MSADRASVASRPKRSACIAIAVFFLHCVVGYGILFAPEKIFGGWHGEGDWAAMGVPLVVFGLPFLGAVTGYYYAFQFVAWGLRRPVLRSSASVCAALFSLWCYMVVLLNTYGS